MNRIFVKLCQKLEVWKADRAERRHRLALIQEHRREQRKAPQLSRNTPGKAEPRPKVSSLVYNISIEPPKISKSAAQQICRGRKFELEVKERRRIQEGETVTLTLHWKSPRKIPRRFPDYFGPWPSVGGIPRGAYTMPEETHRMLQQLTTETPEERKAREELVKMIFADVEKECELSEERALSFIPGIKLPPRGSLQQPKTKKAGKDGGPGGSPGGKY